MKNIELTPEQIQELTKQEVERALLASNKALKKKLDRIYYHLYSACDMLSDVYRFINSSNPKIIQKVKRRPYDVNELKNLLDQGKKPKEIADILGRSIGSVRQKIREL